MFNPFSTVATLDCFTVSYLSIQYCSLASSTNLHWDLTFSIGKATMSQWLWPCNLKWAPTGFWVWAWQCWVAVPTCSLNLLLNGLVVHPMYCGPWPGPPTCEHSPVPFLQLTEYTDHGVTQEILVVIGKDSPVELQVCVELFLEWEQTQQSPLFPTFLKTKWDLSLGSRRPGRQLCSNNNISEGTCSSVTHHWRKGHVGQGWSVPGDQTIPSMSQDFWNISQPLIKRQDQRDSLIVRSGNFFQRCLSV